MQPIKTIIIENEAQSMTTLEIKINKYCPNVQIIDKCFDGKEAVEAIKTRQPQLIFLDIQLGNMSGFDVLDQVQKFDFEIIFITGYNKYAIQAIRASAVDFLLKPVDVEELIRAVSETEKRIKDKKAKTLSYRIILPRGRGCVIIKAKDIMYCIADNVYTNIHMQNGSTYLAVKTLKSIQELLPEDIFPRISKKHIVNLNFIKEIKRGKKGCVVMEDGEELRSTMPIDELLEALT